MLVYYETVPFNDSWSPEGPFTIDEIRQIPLFSKDLIKAEGASEWLPVSDMPELYSILTQKSGSQQQQAIISVPGRFKELGKLKIQAHSTTVIFFLSVVIVLIVMLYNIYKLYKPF